MERKYVKVTLNDGSSYKTEINGTHEEIRKYFAIGKELEFWEGREVLKTITKLEFLEKVES